MGESLVPFAHRRSGYDQRFQCDTHRGDALVHGAQRSLGGLVDDGFPRPGLLPVEQSDHDGGEDDDRERSRQQQVGKSDTHLSPWPMAWVASYIRTMVAALPPLHILLEP